jgi:hypothetical protein
MANSEIAEIKVKIVWVDENQKQAGVRIIFGVREQDLSVRELQNFRGKISNAHVTDYGVRAKAGVNLPKKLLSRQTNRTVETYALMHTNNIVCRVFVNQNKVEIINAKMLPLELRFKNFNAAKFLEWLNRRIDNLSRTYMNKVYIVRKVGRDREKILRDSCAVSITDNYWIKRSDVDTSWEELKIKRDCSLELANTALTGEIKNMSFVEAVEDTT